MTEFRLEGYDLGDELGRGGFGTVYRAYDRQLGRDVAIKVLSSSVDEHNRRRFEREAQALGRLSDHAAIVTVHRAGIADSGQPYLVMAYLRGGTLRDRVDEGRPLPWREAVAIGIRVADALEAAHSAGILHRDIKPANVLLDINGVAHLGDFGIARIEGGFETTAGAVTASVAYAAPEVLAGQPPSKSSDLYSLGATLHAAFSGSSCFGARTDEHMVAQYVRVADQAPPPLGPYGVPAPIADLVERMMAKDPAQRPESAAEVAEVLRAALHHGIEPDGPTVVTARPTPPRPAAAPGVPSARGRSRRVAVLAVVALIVLAVAGVAAVTLGGDDGGSGEDVVAGDDPETATDRGPVGNTGSSTPAVDVGSPPTATVVSLVDGRLVKVDPSGSTVDVTAALEQLGGAGEEGSFAVSPDGAWLVVQSTRFEPECEGYACLVILPADLSSGQLVRSETGEPIRPYAAFALSPGGSHLVYTGPPAAAGHEADLWMTARLGDVWSAPVAISTESVEPFNDAPAFRRDGGRVAFTCGTTQYGYEDTRICSVAPTGGAIEVVVRPEDGAGGEATGAVRSPSFDDAGRLFFEASWSAGYVWYLPPGGGTAAPVPGFVTGGASPCALPGGWVTAIVYPVDHPTLAYARFDGGYVLPDPAPELSDPVVACGGSGGR